jgi:L-amino acid N-acyltransferase YncA
MQFAIDGMRRADWAQVRGIYREGLATGLAAFMRTPPGWKTWDARHLPLGRLVARHRDGAVVGWAALTPVPDT